jgi:hypothetical protein
MPTMEQIAEHAAGEPGQTHSVGGGTAKAWRGWAQLVEGLKWMFSFPVMLGTCLVAKLFY